MNEERRINQAQYLEDISHAIKSMIGRCGVDVDAPPIGPFPEELTVHQREMFIHSGITGLASVGVISKDHDLMEMFDELLVYHVNYHKVDREDHYKMIVNMLSEQLRQIMKKCPDHMDPRFIGFTLLFRLALMILWGHVSVHEIDDILLRCQSLVDEGCDRASDDRRKSAEKN